MTRTTVRDYGMECHRGQNRMGTREITVINQWEVSKTAFINSGQGLEVERKS